MWQSDDFPEKLRKGGLNVFFLKKLTKDPKELLECPSPGGHTMQRAGSHREVSRCSVSDFAFAVGGGLRSEEEIIRREAEKPAEVLA